MIQVFSRLHNFFLLLPLLNSRCGLLLLLFIGIVVGYKDSIGIDLCACSPSTYKFTFDFNLPSCPEYSHRNGIAETFCELVPEDSRTTDLKPVTIDFVNIAETDVELQVIKEESFVGEFFHGDSFTYVSILADPRFRSEICENITAKNITTFLQIGIGGRNSQNDILLLAQMIMFSNECGVFPVDNGSQYAGWTVFTSLDDPPEVVCPMPILVAEPSPTPKSRLDSFWPPDYSPSYSIPSETQLS